VQHLCCPRCCPHQQIHSFMLHLWQITRCVAGSMTGQQQHVDGRRTACWVDFVSWALKAIWLPLSHAQQPLGSRIQDCCGVLLRVCITTMGSCSCLSDVVAQQLP
jgi:hypothetical protein